MIVQKPLVTSLNANLTTLAPSADERAIRAIPGLAMWYEGAPEAFDQSGGGFAWVDRITGRRMVPLREAPILRTVGGRKVVRFGYSGSLSVGANGVLGAEDTLPTLGRTAYTIGIVARTPPTASTEVGGGGSGGIYVGSRIDGSYFMMLNDYNTGGFQARNVISGDLIVVSGPQYNPSIDYDDGAWRTIVLAYYAPGTAALLRVNGALVASYGAVQTGVATGAGSDQLLIGGAGSTGTGNRFVGEIGAVLVIKDRAIVDAEMTAFEARLNLIRSQLVAAGG